MRPGLFRFLAAALAVSSASQASEPTARFGGSTPLEWSEKLARSEMARQGDSLEFRSGQRGTWTYAAGFFAYALERLGKEGGDRGFADYGARIVDSFIRPDGSIRGYDEGDYNLDLITPGRAVLVLYEQTRDPRLAAAARILRRQLAHQPRTSDGGFWHKRIYPNQMWLDGLYMAGPFYARFGVLFAEPAAAADATRQILLADRHLYDPGTGLYYHAWDESRAQAWADRQTGHSPNFWARALGWYGMAVVDVLDDLPADDPSTDQVEAVLHRIAAGIVRWQDPDTGVWWQVLDQGSRAGNYRESSASSMYVYTLAKAVNRGRLPPGSFRSAAMSGYAGLIRQFIRTGPAGEVILENCCSVAGLGNTNSAGRARDGSFAYYVSEPVVPNDLKGVAAFILASVEVQRLLGSDRSSPAR